MQLGDNLGFAGIVLGLLCGGLVAAFPNRRSIGFGLIGATLLSAAVWWFVAHHEKHEAEKIRPSVSWMPAPLVEGQPLSATQLNARAFVDGKEIEVENPVYNPTFGSLLSPGSQTISVTLTPRNSALYLPVTQTVTVRVLGRPVSHSAPRAPSPPVAEDPNVALLNRSESLLASFTSWRSTRIADRDQMLERFHKEHDGRFEKDTMDRMEAYRRSEWWAETLAQYRQLYTAELLKDRRELFAVATMNIRLPITTNIRLPITTSS